MIVIKPDAVRPLLDQIASGTARYDGQFHVQIAWPQTVSYEGSRYFKTGKEGTRFKDGMPSAEYQAEKRRRLWLGLDGAMARD